MVPEKGPPGLTAATRQVLRAVLGDRARRDAPPELRKLAGNPVLAPQAVFSPDTPDEGSQLGVDRRPADSTAAHLPGLVLQGEPEQAGHRRESECLRPPRVTCFCGMLGPFAANLRRLLPGFALLAVAGCGGRESGTSPASSCNDNGTVHASGTTWTCSDGCNTCSCSNGEIASTLVACLGPEGGTSGAEGGDADATVSADASGLADAVPADGAVKANAADAGSEGGSCSIRASDYDQSCQSDSDCVEVVEGDFCGQSPCLCPNAAIRVSAESAYNAELSKLLPTSPVLCNCPIDFGPHCNGGVCGRCLTTLCRGVCVDEKTDPNNCGACGMTCPTGQACQEGSCGNPPSCAPAGPGMTNCGPGGSGSESCCTSLEVTGGTFYRTYTNDGSGPTGEADPAAVSTFRLDKYDVTVGRFRQFVSAVLPPDGGAGWLPGAGSGKHTHLNGGNGLAATGGGFEPGWVASDNSNVAPTNANLVSCSPYSTWTASAGSQENLPMNCVNWWESYAFCIWDRGFLPSEAEWRYAAAGGSQQRAFPWGSVLDTRENAISGCSYPNGSGQCSSVANIAPVGTARLGAGSWGQLDLMGEVFQWNLDWFDESYVNPCSDCLNLTASSSRVVGGSGFGTGVFVPPVRNDGNPMLRDGNFGFRCARTP